MQIILSNVKRKVVINMAINEIKFCPVMSGRGNAWNGQRCEQELLAEGYCVCAWYNKEAQECWMVSMMKKMAEK